MGGLCPFLSRNGEVNGMEDRRECGGTRRRGERQICGWDVKKKINK
jgi:RecJ-like exonuclease